MKPTANTEDPVAKTVGRRVAPDPMALVAGEKAQKQAWAKAGFFPRYPKGVYRFQSFEEADQWLMDHSTPRRAS